MNNIRIWMAVFLFSWLLIFWLPQDVLSQKAIRVGIFPFEYVSGEPGLKKFETQLTVKLREALNRSKTVNFAAEIIADSLLEKAASGIPGNNKVKGLISIDILSNFKNIMPLTYDFFLQGIIWEQNTIVHVYFVVLDNASLKTFFEISAKAGLEGTSFEKPYNVIDTLVERTLNIMSIRFAKNIRIAVLDFEMTGGDSARFGFFEKSLPSMLASGLSVSSRLQLLETSKEDTLLSEILKGRTVSGIYNYATAIEVGSQLHANYLVMGEYWELDGRMRIDVRCVSIESGEITAMRGINIDNININTINKSMERLAADLRSTIEADFINKGERAPSIAVTGFPPSPNTSDNYVLLFNLIKTTSRKLKTIPALRVKENAEQVKKFLKVRRDRWEMSSELGADLLLSFQLDRTDPENVVIDMDLFDALNQEEIIFNATETASIIALNTVVNNLVNIVITRLEKARGLNLAGINRQKMLSIKYQGLYQRYGLDFRLGGILRNDADPFLGYQGGVVFELSLLWLPFSSSKWQVEPFTIKFDFLSYNRTQKTFGFDYLLAVKYKARPYSSINPFVGIGFTILGVDRIGPTDWMYEGGIGMAVLAGLESYSGSSWHMNYELKWSGAPKLKTKEVGGRTFSGGRLGGFQFTVGIGRNW